MTDPAGPAIPAPDELEIAAGPWVTPAVDILDLVGQPNREIAVPVGVPALDRPSGGLLPGTLHIVCLPPGVSRSRLVLRAALNAAGGAHTTLACLLGPPPAAVAAMLTELTLGAAGEDAQQAGNDQARPHLAALPLGIIAGQLLGVHDIRALAWAAADRLQLIVVDAITLLRDGDAAALKRLAVELHCALLAAVTVAPVGATETFVPDPTLLDAADVVAWAPGGVVATVFAGCT